MHHLYVHKSALNMDIWHFGEISIGRSIRSIFVHADLFTGRKGLGNSDILQTCTVIYKCLFLLFCTKASCYSRYLQFLFSSSAPTFKWQ